MDKLPNECLALIFDSLPIVDRIRIEGVCRRWNDVSQDSWRSCKRLNLRSATWVSEFGRTLIVNKRIFDKAIRLCGQYLTSIIFNESEEGISVNLHGRNLLKEICQSCPNIQELDLIAIPYMSNDKHFIIPCLKPLSSRIRRLGLRLDMVYDNTTDLAEFFGTLDNLRIVHLSHYNVVWDRDQLLLDLPLENLVEIGFRSACFGERDSETLDVVMRESTKTLRTLHISRIKFDTLDLFIEAVSCNAALKNLTLDRCYGCSDVDGMKIAAYVSKLTQLETLDIQESDFVDDRFIEVIASNCKHLKELNISYTKVTDDGILFISALQELRCLKMKSLGKNLKFHKFEIMPNLEELDCSRCHNLQCSSLCDFVLKATHLRVLNVTYCHLITNELVLVSVRALKMRDDNKILKIIARGTKIKVDEDVLQEKPASLAVIL